MIHNAEQFSAWIERNSAEKSKASLYRDIARLTGTPYYTVRNWYQMRGMPNHAALRIINEAIKTEELPR